jgi:nitrogen fixation protein FixH
MSRTFAVRPAAPTERPLKGWMVLAMITAFFGTVMIANGALIYFALSTFSGEEETNPYEHGLAYDKDIAAAHAQDALHWQAVVHLARLAAGEPPRLEFALRDAQGQPLAGLAVVATLEFPASKRFDRTIDLVEEGPGVYRGEAAVAAGQWDVFIEAKRDNVTVFRSHNHIALP